MSDKNIYKQIERLIVDAIHEKRRLIATMVGELYPRIVQGEIDELYRLLEYVGDFK